MEDRAERADLPERAPPGPSAPEDAAAERENRRAQSTVSMYRQPANRVPRSSHPIWRLRAPREGAEGRTISGFDSELRVMSRVLGVGFVALVAATIGLIGWQLVVTAPSAPAAVEDSKPSPEEPETPAAPAVPVADSPEPRRNVLSDFSGELRDGFDTALPVGPGQGVLQLAGPPEVTVRVDGIDRGALPVVLVLDQGRHVVRYDHAGRRSVRFYFVKAGATRALEILTRPGGFVDAH